MSGGALAGLRVVELGEFEAAAYCGKLFADLGAEVVKVEPAGGDPGRKHPPLVGAGEGRWESAHFAWLNTGKQSLAAPDEAAVGALALAADVLIDGRPGEAAAEWRSGAARRNPRLTVVELSWFGRSGPYRDFAATDATVRALAGIVWPTGAPGEPPAPLADHQASIVGGLNAFTAALAARFSGAPGRRFEVSLLEANLSISEFYAALAASGLVDRRYGRNRFFPTFPMGVYPCRQGWLGVSVVTLDQWRGFCELLGLEDLAADPELMTAIGRFARADALERIYAPPLKEKTAAEWFDLALKMRLPLAIAPDMAELCRQDAHRRRGAFAPVRIGAAEFEAPVVPQILTRPKPPANGVAPLAGEHDFNWSAAERGGPASPGGAAGERPLAGVRIIDLTMGWAGPLATRQLGDLGAEILKVESCGYPDWWRGADPRPEAVRERQFE
jgi:crotonobetainyl-CoA:carnitine CoA-transferase CaiB-like acyl-CoA transferase